MLYFFTLAALLLAVTGRAVEQPQTFSPSSPYQFSTNWFRRSTAQLWRKHLSFYVDKPNITYLEVGVFEGRSLLWMLDNILKNPSSKALALDIFKPRDEQVFRGNLEKSGHKNRVQIIKERSETALRRLSPESVDIIYIDGAHDMRTVLIDAINSWYLLKVGGILIFDDYQMAKDRFPTRLRPEHAIDTFLMAFTEEVAILEKGYQVILTKKKKPEPWCQSCTYFADFRYEWYKQRLINEQQTLHLGPNDSLKLEKFLKQFEQNKTLDLALPLAKKLWLNGIKRRTTTDNL